MTIDRAKELAEAVNSPSLHDWATYYGHDLEEQIANLIEEAFAAERAPLEAEIARLRARLRQYEGDDTAKENA